MGLCHIKFAQPDIVQLGRQYCINCAKRRLFVLWHEDWYGWYGTCLKCGEQFAGDEWLPRPFAPRWRPQNIKKAKKFYEKHCGAKVL
jgi:hypothetical protein